jgi:hypothetical protein
MDLQGIREALRNRPFQPFFLRLADGRDLPVPHPEAVALGKRRLIVLRPDNSWSVVEPLHVVSLDFSARGSTRGQT